MKLVKLPPYEFQSINAFNCYSIESRIPMWAESNWSLSQRLFTRLYHNFLAPRGNPFVSINENIKSDLKKPNE